MPNETGNRPPTKGGTTEEKTSENRGGATRGPAGAIRRARNTAPGAAGTELMQAVALRAYRDDADPEDVWAAIDDTDDSLTVEFELACSTVAVQASPVGLVARVEHETKPVEYALLADDTARALARVADLDGGGGT